MFVLTCSKMATTGSALHVSAKMGPVKSFRPWQVEQMLVKTRWPRVACSAV
jgi:hypothetical protein